MINITKEKLADLLNKAFEEGICGYQDLKESFVEKLIEDCVQECEEVQKKTTQSTIPPLHTPASDVYVPLAPNRPSDYSHININWDNNYSSPLVTTGTWSPQITNSYTTNTTNTNNTNTTNTTNDALLDLSFRVWPANQSAYMDQRVEIPPIDQRVPNEIPPISSPEGFRITI